MDEVSAELSFPHSSFCFPWLHQIRDDQEPSNAIDEREVRTTTPHSADTTPHSVFTPLRNSLRHRCAEERRQAELFVIRGDVERRQNEVKMKSK